MTYKIDYKKHHGNNGYVYTQTITIKDKKDLIDILNGIIQTEKILKKDDTNIQTYLKYIDISNIEDLYYLTISQLQILKGLQLFKNDKRVKNDRNTIILIK